MFCPEPIKLIQIVWIWNYINLIYNTIFQFTIKLHSHEPPGNRIGNNTNRPDGSQCSGDWSKNNLWKMDNLSNLASRFVDLLMYIELKDVDSEMKTMYNKSLNNILEMALLLKESIKLLREKPINLIFNINNIHELCNSTDKLFHQFLHYLYKDKDVEIRNLLIIRDSVVTLEQYVDKINHIIEIVRVLNYE